MALWKAKFELCNIRDKSRSEAFDLYKKSLELYVKASNLNHDYALITVANMHINGELGVKNYRKAEQYIKKAISTNSQDGYAALGALYIQMGDIKKAVNYLKKSSDKGSAIAPVVLFDLYNCGYGKFKPNVKLANNYKNMAHKNANANVASLKDIESIFTNQCPNIRDSAPEVAFSYTHLDLINDYFSKNRYLIGIIPSVWKSFAK